MKVGWLYAVSSLLTLVIINGILTFMLTPGESWQAVAGTGQESSRFWQAFFNPTYWPGLLLRTVVCVSLAGVWALVTASRLGEESSVDLRRSFIRWSSRWLVPSFVAMPFLLAWYLWQVPESQRALLSFGISTIGSGAFTQVTRMALIIVMSSATIAGLVYFLAWRSAEDFGFGHALAILGLALVCTASTEYSREMLRKPYVIGQHMYSNGVRKRDVERFNKEGYLTNTLWVADGMPVNLAKGQAMFRGQCMACHTVDAYRPMETLLAGRDRAGIRNLLGILHEAKADSPYRAFMPPLVGTTEEIDALADYLLTIEKH
jgi:hypothetical protein